MTMIDDNKYHKEDTWATGTYPCIFHNFTIQNINDLQNFSWF